LALRDKLLLLFTIKDSPHRLSLAFSVGVFVGMSPLLGLHTILGIGLAWVLKLNKFATLIGVYVTNPWTIIPIYTFSTWIGAKCLGVHDILPAVDWGNLSFRVLVNEFSPLLMPFIVGTTLVGLCSAFLAYAIVLTVFRRRHG
jgi:hypothetical protein